MSLCENASTFPRGEICKDCSLGKRGNVSKIFNKLKEEGLVSWYAGKVWLKRSGITSTPAEMNSDYLKAVKYYTIKICKGLG